MIVTGVSQQVLPLLPADATPIGPVAGLVETVEGGVVFVSGQASFAFAAGDETARRLAAVQLVTTGIASRAAVAAAFGVTTVTVWRWRAGFETAGVAGVIPVKRGPKRPSKLTETLAARIRELDGQGCTLAEIAEATGVSTATVRVALGRRAGSAGGEARHRRPEDDDGHSDADDESDGPGESGDPGAGEHADGEHGDEREPGDRACGEPGGRGEFGDQGGADLPVLPVPVPRTAERGLARWGVLDQAGVVFTEGKHLPLAGLLLILPALQVTGLLEAFTATFGRLRNGFYGLRATVLTMLFLALLRDPRAEGATHIRPDDLGRVLGLDRAPEVKTLRRKLTELAAYHLGAQLQATLARAHAASRPHALGFLHIDGHARVYTGTRDLPKTHVGRLHLVTHATTETWIADANADPVLVITAVPGSSLAGELTRSIPHLRALLGDRRATVIFDRGGWSPVMFATLIDAGLDVLTYRKAPYERLPETAFTRRRWRDPDGHIRAYTLAESTVELPLGEHDTLAMRQVTRLGGDGVQIPIITSNRRIAAANVAWRMGGRWRHENYFKYARGHFALDALDSYADIADDPTRLVPNPAKKTAKARVDAARAEIAGANRDLATALDDAAVRAGHPDAGGEAIVDPAPERALDAARDRLECAAAESRSTPTHLPLAQVRPNARLLDEERKLITHAIRMSAYNAETTLARMLAPHYAPAEHEVRALLREAFTLSGDIQITNGKLRVRLDPATAPRRSRALRALCEQLTATETIYPDTNLTITYEIKDHLDAS